MIGRWWRSIERESPTAVALLRFLLRPWLLVPFLVAVVVVAVAWWA